MSVNYKPVLPCVVCGSPDHEGYFDCDGERLLSVECPNKDTPQAKAKIAEVRKAMARFLALG